MKPALNEFPFISKHDAARLLGISTRTLLRWRQAPEMQWIENVHFTRRDNGEWQYNQRILEAWRDRAIDPHGYANLLQTFQQAIAQSERRQRKAS